MLQCWSMAAFCCRTTATVVGKIPSPAPAATGPERGESNAKSHSARLLSAVTERPSIVQLGVSQNRNQSLQLPHRRSSVVLKEVQEGAILFSTEAEVYFSLNQIGLQVWRLLPPVCSHVDEVVERIHTQFPEVSPDTISADVRRLLAELRDHELVESGPTLTSRE